MQRHFSPYTIDPSCLNLKAHPIAPTHNAELSLAVDDVAIASGQARYDYDRNDYSNTSSNPYVNEYPIDDFELDDLEPDSPQATQACSAPISISATGGGGINSDFSSQYAGSSSVGDGTLGNRLQMFASGASSAPGPDYRDSRIHQDGPPSPFPSYHSEPGFSFGSSRGSHRPQQASPLQQRMLRAMQLAHATRINTCSGDLQYTRFGKDYTDGENDDWDEADGSLGLHNPSFPSSLSDDNTMAGGLTSSTTEARPILHRRRDGNPEMEHVRIGADYPAHCFDPGIGRDLMGESWQKLPSEDLDSLTANEPSWQQQQDLNPAAGRILGSANAGCESGQGLTTRNQHSTPEHLYSASYENDAHEATSERSPDCPGAIMIPGSSKRYDADLTSSFPPTAGHFPNYILTVQRPEYHQSTPLNTQPFMDLSKHASLSLRRKTSKTKPSKRSRAGSLKAIQEQDNPLGTSPTGSLRGRRKGHLDRATALAAGQKRSDGTVCIRCKMLKQTASPCEGNLPCEGCQKNSNARSWGQPCQKAKFMDMIEAGTCNAVFQRSASVRPIDGDQRVCLQFSGRFDLDEMIDSLRTHESQYNIGVFQFSGSSYTLDLGRLTKLMVTVQGANKKDSYELDDFSGHKASKASDWLKCVTDFDQSVSVMERSIVWNNMPSRNSYFYLPLNESSCRPMDINNEEDGSAIRLAVHLCRIVLRALEVNAFSTLQKEVNDLPKNKFSNTDIEALAQNLVKILFSLRWRIAWWAVVGVSMNIKDDLKGRYTERISMLAQTLYFWYFVLRKRLSPRVASASKGIWNLYADAAQAVLERYPEDESIDGFHAWMALGRKSIHRAYVLHSVPQPFPSS